MNNDALPPAPVLPPALRPGDTIGVFAPSSYVEREDIEKSKALMENAGYKVFIHPQTYERCNQSAGTDLQKALAFQGLWQRPDIDAIWAAGGGNRCLHLIESINFEKLKARPKLLIGFSDVTALLNAVYARAGIVTIHGPVFKNIHKYKQLSELTALLSGQPFSVPKSKAQILREGRAEGLLIGGNLSIVQYLPGTLHGAFAKGAILFLEDCNEELSKIDRMMLHLRRTELLNEIAGLALGQFTGLTDSGRPYGFTLEDIVREQTEGLDIPVVVGLPFGHGEDLSPLPVGAKAILDTSSARILSGPGACASS